MSREPALLTSVGRMPERSQHRVSEGQDGRSERPAMGHGQPRAASSVSLFRYSREVVLCPPPEGGFGELLLLDGGGGVVPPAQSVARVAGRGP